MTIAQFRGGNWLGLGERLPAAKFGSISTKISQRSLLPKPPHSLILLAVFSLTFSPQLGRSNNTFRMW
jgi:hypothetical protein